MRRGKNVPYDLIVTMTDPYVGVVKYCKNLENIFSLIFQCDRLVIEIKWRDDSTHLKKQELYIFIDDREESAQRYRLLTQIDSMGT